MKKTASYFNLEDLEQGKLDTICAQQCTLSDYPNASELQKNILIYDGLSIRENLSDDFLTRTIKSEFISILKEGPGVFVIKNSFENLEVVDQTTDAFLKIISNEKIIGKGQGDHFGTNERIWNSLQKLAEFDVDLFLEYYGNEIIALVSDAWLGPHYQLTAQVNNVKPGGKAQVAHRDYHLGFQESSKISQYPAHAQLMSQFLTLQGAIAHSNVSLKSGPTVFFPYSQLFGPGYMMEIKGPFEEILEKHKVQIPFEKGDMVFFNPALFHGAGTNQTDSDRLVNLVQVSSPFGKTMESLNRHSILKQVYPKLLELSQSSHLSEHKIKSIVTASADGYAFPTNLDRDPPIDGHAPKSDYDIIIDGLTNKTDWDTIQGQLAARETRRLA